MSYPGFPLSLPAWPGLASQAVIIGGTAVTVAEAVAAAALLEASRTSAVAPVLARAGSPLASCDYRAAAAPFLPARRRDVPLTGRSGAAGRHLVKDALIEAIACSVEEARLRDVAAALRTFASDERYHAAIAAAVTDRKASRSRAAA